MATDLTNITLESYNLEDTMVQLGKEAPKGTRSLLARRYASKVTALRRVLNDLLDELKEIYTSMEEARVEFEGCIDGTHASLDDPRADVALCTLLTHRQVCRIAEDIVGMYQKELRVKTKVVHDFGRVSSDSYKERGFWHVHIAAWMTGVFVVQDVVENNMNAIALDAGMPYSGTPQRSS